MGRAWAVVRVEVLACGHVKGVRCGGAENPQVDFGGSGSKQQRCGFQVNAGSSGSAYRTCKHGSFLEAVAVSILTPASFVQYNNTFIATAIKDPPQTAHIQPPNPASM